MNGYDDAVVSVMGFGSDESTCTGKKSDELQVRREAGGKRNNLRYARRQAVLPE
jgi:hypothetical protein